MKNIAADIIISDDTIAAVAVEAAAHPRTVERRLLGLEVRGRVAARVDAALARRGLLRVTPRPRRRASRRDDHARPSAA